MTVIRVILEKPGNSDIVSPPVPTTKLKSVNCDLWNIYRSIFLDLIKRLKFIDKGQPSFLNLRTDQRNEKDKQTTRSTYS